MSSIPYDPSLILGNIVDPDRITVLEEISSLQAQIDSKFFTMNQLIMLKRKLSQTAQDLVNMQVDPGDLYKQLETTGTQITAAATEYAKTAGELMPQISEKRGSIRMVSKTMESPIDYAKSKCEPMPLSTDSLQLDAQYFSEDKTDEQGNSTMASVSSFVAASCNRFGAERSAEVGASAQSQVDSQRKSHKLEGTLIISCVCTHKVVNIFAPFVLNPDKAVSSWNGMFEDDRLNPEDPDAMVAARKEMGETGQNKMTLLSGCTYGSSFVGMVHVLKNETTKSSQVMISTAANLQTQFDVGCWFAKASGSMGVDASFSNSARQMLSSMTITSHISLVTMGIIPSIKSNTMKYTVATGFSDKDPMGTLAGYQNATNTQLDSVLASAKGARTGQGLQDMKRNDIQSVISGLDAVEKETDSMLDINTMMTAFEDYVQKAIAGEAGCPINYYLKVLTKAQIAAVWCDLYVRKPQLDLANDGEVPEEEGGGEDGDDGDDDDGN